MVRKFQDISLCLRYDNFAGLGELGWRFLKADYSYLVPLLTIEGSTTQEVRPDLSWRYQNEKRNEK